MKKLFYVVALVAAVVLTGCGKKSVSSLPEELRVEIEKADALIADALVEAQGSEEFQQMNAIGIEISYEGVEVDGRDIIFTLKMGGPLMENMSLSGILATQGITEEAFNNELRRAIRRGDFFDELDVDDRRIMELLCEYEYNLGIRMKGEMKDDCLNLVVAHEDLCN